MLSRMPGPVALVGSGEFLPAMADFDAGLLAVDRPLQAPRRDPADGVLAGRRPRSSTAGPRRAPPTSPALGAEVEPVLVRDRVDADDAVHAQAIGEADLIYLSGGKPDYLSSTLCGTAVGRALRGGPRAGGGAGRAARRGR